MRSERASVHRSSFPWAQVLYAALFFGMVATGLYLGYAAYTTLRDIAADTRFQPLPVFSASSDPSNPQSPSESGSSKQPQPQNPGTPENEIRVPILEDQSRVNILFLGIDQRPGEPIACRTDTMILVSVNPKTMSASLLSIPRDLWVPIPAVGKENRINTAHYWGEVTDYPGGGPALAKHTVRYNFGVPVHYYVRLNFVGFEQIIDTMGGIDIYVDQAIHDTKYPGEDLRYTTLDIPAGDQHFDGEMALKYARTRKGNGDGDFSRMGRQQQVILAVRDKVLSLPNLPKLIIQIPELARTLENSLSTDIPPQMMVTLAQWAQQIKSENIRMDAIDRRVTTDKVTAEGWEVLQYDRAKARPIIDEMFKDPTPEANTPESSSANQLEKEAAHIAVYNGTTTPGLAATIAAFLEMQGPQIVEKSNADHPDYEHTVLIVYGDKPDTIHWLQSWLADLGISPTMEFRAVESDVDIAIIVGQDFPADKVR